jgi:hypothetical protein
MLKMLKTTTAATCLALGLIASPAQAVFINGSIGIGDSGITLSNLPGSMVSALLAMTLGPTAATGPCTFDFAACPAVTPGTALTLPLSAPGAMTGTFTSGIFTFTFGSVVFMDRDAPQNIGGNLITDHIGFIATGIVDDGVGGFDPTAAVIAFNATGNCIGTGTTCNAGSATATWQATLSATGSNTAPEPGTLALIGVALAGLGFARRKQA